MNDHIEAFKQARKTIEDCNRLGIKNVRVQYAQIFKTPPRTA